MISYLRKAATFILGVSGLVVGTLMCATIAFAPKGLVVAGTSIKILRTLLDGSDYITQQTKTIEKNNAIVRKVEILEQQHEELSHALQRKPRPTRKVAYARQAQPKSKTLESEAKIERLLMGYKADDILSREDLEEIRKRHQKLAPQMTAHKNVEKVPTYPEETPKEDESSSDDERPGPHSHL